MKVPRLCAVDGCHTRIGLEGLYCDEHDYPVGNLNGNCRLCGARVERRKKPAHFVCSASCRAVLARREAVRETARIGDNYFDPVNNIQTNLHRAAVRRKERRYAS